MQIGNTLNGCIAASILIETPMNLYKIIAALILLSSAAEAQQIYGYDGTRKLFPAPALGVEGLVYSTKMPNGSYELRTVRIAGATLSTVNGVLTLTITPTIPPVPDPDPVTVPTTGVGPDGGALTVTAPVNLSGVSNRTYDHVKISNPNGPCIVAAGGSNIKITNSEIGPCKGHGIYLTGGSSYTISNNYVHDTWNNIAIEFASNVSVIRNILDKGSSGVYGQRVQGFRVERNEINNQLGPHPEGQAVQFNSVSGAGNTIKCNTIRNDVYWGTPPHVGIPVTGADVRNEDKINTFGSSGTPDSPILIAGNKILGGGSSPSGTGINVGDTFDGPGAYTDVFENIVVNPGQAGIALSGGTRMRFRNNKVFGAKAAYTNVGITAWKAYGDGHPCVDIEVTGNKVNWFNRDGAPTPNWGDGKCSFSLVSGNSYGSNQNATGGNDTTITAAIANETPGVCAVTTASLSWEPSVSANVAGYNVYRSLLPAGEETKITPAPVNAATLLDSGLKPGSYYYTATAVDTNGNESVRSNQAIAVIP